MTDATAFLNWNKALFNYYFPQDLEEDEEVSLFVDKKTIDGIGQRSGLGGYDEFLHCILLPIDDRRQVYLELRQLIGLGIQLSRDQRHLLRSENLFDFATIFIDNDFYTRINCPLYLAYIVFAVLMGGECSRLERRDIGGYLTERLREAFPNHSARRNSLSYLFSSLAKKHPQFRAKRITSLEYIGLIKYQLGLSVAQEASLKKAMHNADLSEDLPFDLWALKLRDYTDDSIRHLLNNSLHDPILRFRLISLRSSFDPILYEQSHQNEGFCSHGSFVLAVYEDEFTRNNDKLVLLTDVNNRSISNGHLKIVKGCIDRLGEYAQYNINHVLIDDQDKAEMKAYAIRTRTERITSEALRNIVTFQRHSSHYLIQTNHPQKGKETYILVKSSCEEEWNKWIEANGNPSISHIEDNNYVRQIFGNGWEMFISKEIDYAPVTNRANNQGTHIIMNGGIRCIGMNNVYLINALPYFEFPETIDLDRLSIYININDVSIDKSEFELRVADGNKLIIDFPRLSVCKYSHEVSITLEYIRVNNSRLSLHEEFSIIGQDIQYNEADLFPINMWGSMRKEGENVPYMKGFLLNGIDRLQLPHNTILYQNFESEIDINDQRFILINLFTAICCMKSSFSTTEKQLEKCVRYAASRFDTNITSNSSFFRDIKYLLINSGYINTDYESRKYQPNPPTFVETPMATTPGGRLFMLIGSYTKKFLTDLLSYCKKNCVRVFQHSISKTNDIVSLLLPPVILLQYNFDPRAFKTETGSQFIFIPNDDIAINIFRSIPTYSSYERTLFPVPTNVLPMLTDSHNIKLPRIRKSMATGYGASQWIETPNGDFKKITIHDPAWAELYCLYHQGIAFCTKDNNSILIPRYLHLPVMMQRALYIANLGVPKKEKAFICFKDKKGNNYYDIVKRYEIKEPLSSKRASYVIKSITGRDTDEANPSLRNCSRCPDFRLFYWKNKLKHSQNPRSLLVMKNRNCSQVYGFAIKCGEDNISIYFKYELDKDLFKLVDGNDLNYVFSLFMTSRGTWNILGISFKDTYMALPFNGEYEEEEIAII